MVKQILVIGFLIAVLSCAYVIAQTPAADLPSAVPPNNAKVYVEEYDFNFGYMPSDAFVSHSYWLFSHGKDSLKILRVKPACGCTKAPLIKEVLAPGDSAPVELVFHANAGQRGHAQKSATVTVNDNNKGNFQLQFSAEIYNTAAPDSLTPISLSKSMVKWDPTNKSSRQTITLKNGSGMAIGYKIVSSPKGFVNVDAKPGLIQPGKTVDMSFAIAGEFTGLEFQKSLTLECNDVKKTRYTIPLTLVSQTTPTTTTAPSAQGSH